MLNGTTLACLSFALAVIALMITDDKQWLYLGFGIAVVLVVFQIVRDKRAKYKE
jgi:L-asparagine transporter-like permease